MNARVKMDSGKAKKPRQKPRKTLHHQAKRSKPPKPLAPGLGELADSFIHAVGAFLNALLTPQGIPFGTSFLCRACGCVFTSNVLPQYCPNCRTPFGMPGPFGFPPKPEVKKMSKTAARQFLREHGDTYRAAARKLHPDNKETGSEELFKKLQEAMEVLTAP